MLVRVDSGGCSSALTSVYQTLTITPTSPGERPRPLIVGPPTRRSRPGRCCRRSCRPASSPTSGCPGLPDLAVADRPRGKGAAVAPTSASGPRAARASSCAAALLCLLNKTRRAHGLRRLRANNRLLKAAERHSKSMVVRGYFSHVEPGGVGSIDRVRRTGYLSGARSWTCGENIG